MARMYRIGILQGRLSKPQGNRLQFFPSAWEDEFGLAKDMGLDHIEWFLDQDIPGFDPIRDVWLRADMVEKIDKAIQVVSISSVDAGMYLTFGARKNNTLTLFEKLLPTIIPRLSTGIVNIPLLEIAAPKTFQDKEESKKILDQLLEMAQSCGGKMGLETEMPADELIDFIDSFQNNNIGVCYDTGNCTSYGFDCPQDIKILGNRILEVHLKDRKVGSTQSVMLGTGDTDFKGCFSALKSVNYTGLLTLQAWRGSDYLSDASKQLAFVKNLLK